MNNNHVWLPEWFCNIISPDFAFKGVNDAPSASRIDISVSRNIVFMLSVFMFSCSKAIFDIL